MWFMCLSLWQFSAMMICDSLLCCWSLVPLGHWYHWVTGTIGSLVPLGHWYNWVIGTCNIRSLVSLGRWYDWVAGTIGSLVLLNHWYHRVIGIIELLVPLGHWYYCVMHWFSHLSKLAYLAMIYYLEYVAFVYKLILCDWCISVSDLIRSMTS